MMYSRNYLRQPSELDVTESIVLLDYVIINYNPSIALRTLIMGPWYGAKTVIP